MSGGYMVGVVMPAAGYLLTMLVGGGVGRGSHT